MSVFLTNRNIPALLNKIKYFLLVFTLCISIISNAQINRVANLPGFDEKFIRFGFILAINNMHYAIKPANDINTRIYDDPKQLPSYLPVQSFDHARLYSVEYRPTLGFAVGIVSNMRLHKYFDLRFVPQLSLGSRELKYDYMVFESSGTDTLLTDIIKVPSAYLDFPLVLKFKSKRIMDYRPYIFGGINPSIDLASQSNKTDVDNRDPKLLRYDVGALLGVGCDLYMNWFKFGVELQMLFGSRDMLKQENTIYTAGIDHLKSKVFQVTLTFE